MHKPATDKRLLEILVDPISKVPLRYDAARIELINDAGKRAYPVQDGIPLMVLELARDTEQQDITG